MRDELLDYYTRELTFLRQLGAEFAEKYPKIASRLVLEPDRCEDPHVERLIEAFAFLAARVHLKLEDEFPQITEALLGMLYPHYLRPVPSMSVVEFHLDPEQGKLTTGLTVPRDTMLYSRPAEGYPCKFRTCYDTTLWPLRVVAAQWTTPDRLRPPLRTPAVAVLRLELRCLPDVTFEKLALDRLRFYLSGDSQVVFALYELLLNNAFEILLRDPTAGSRVRPVSLPRHVLRPVGFQPDEGVLPYPRRSFLAYRLLQEYFAFPEKFLFIELGGLDALARAQFQECAEILLLISPFERAERHQVLELGVSEKTLRPFTTPVINLFPQTAEPILLDQTRYEYPVIPDVRRRRSMEVFSVDEVVSSSPRSPEVIRFEPFYSFRHGARRDRRQTFWMTTRHLGERVGDSAPDVYLMLVDLSGRPARPDVDTLTVRCTCTNRDLPSRLPFGSEMGDFEMEGVSGLQRIVCLHKPTATIRPPTGRGALWRLVSHLALNYLSLVEEGREALQEILRLYNFSDSAYLDKQIAGITQVHSEPHFARVRSDYGVSFARGLRVHVRLDEQQFEGGGAYLFASVLENFLGLYVAMNSFVEVVVSTEQRKEVMRAWPPRAGRQILL
ncbi:MAG: type VI secretion system baseplate subunit TssF [Bryobacterales bacterium]|nr:type VI secretion system baseplate subunit TssF [Bryobacteraceae bacterium]MDW8129666.1 type VI secretion system baseplate subunit TssF [Bryobacterales bacterium]